MKVAVVITLFNGRRWIRETLDSVLAQTSPPAELVVVDDGSSDGSADLASDVPGVRLLQNPRKGTEHARVHGATKTTSPLLAFLDQDDAWHPRHLEFLTAALAGDPSAPAAVAGHRSFKTGAQPPMAETPRTLTPLNPWDFYPLGSIETPSAVLIRREHLDRIGGWPAGFISVSDTFAWLALAAERPLIYSAAQTVARRIHKANQSTALRSGEMLQKYLASRLVAIDTVRAFRLRFHPEEERDVARRFEIGERLMTVARDLPLERGADLETPLRDLLEALKSEPPPYRTFVFRGMLWLAGANRSLEPAAEYLTKLLRALPASETRTRSEFREMLIRLPWNPRAFLKLLLGRSGRPAAPALVCRILLHKTLQQFPSANRK